MNSANMAKAMKTIAPIVGLLTQTEWEIISNFINSHYEKKAAKVQLDGEEIKQLAESFEWTWLK